MSLRHSSVGGLSRLNKPGIGQENYKEHIMANEISREDFMDYDDDNDFYDDDEICGYRCICCGSTVGPDECDGEECPCCMANALVEIYF